MTRTLQDIAPIIRSKNAGPTLLTLDVLFEDAEGFELGVAALTTDTVASLYHRHVSEVSIIPYPVAIAVKITIPRAVNAGAPGDRDCYGAQQHGPLLSVPI